MDAGLMLVKLRLFLNVLEGRNKKFISNGNYN